MFLYKNSNNMNVLFDFVSTQGIFNGGAEYTLRVFDSLYQAVISNRGDVNIYCLFDRNKTSSHKRFSYDSIKKEYPRLSIVFFNDSNLEELIKINKIDVFFIGIGQRYVDVNFSNLSCKIIMVIHDALYSEEKEGHFSEYLNMLYPVNMNPIKKTVSRLINRIRNKNKKEVDVKLFFDAICNSSNVEIITVSEYSKNSIIVYGGIRKNIKVFYSPSKIVQVDKDIESDQLRAFLELKKKYFIIVSSERILKNAKNALKAVRIYNELFDDNICVLTLGMKDSLFDGHYCLPYLSPSDLEHAYKNCYALLYPSVLEGFGYPPLEVMKYGKPVLSSNVCSMPEILGDAPSYFSPFYVSDIVRSIKKLTNNVGYYSQKSMERYKAISNKQNKDLELLIKYILN